MASNTMAEECGFDLDFVDTPEDYLKCVICHYVLKDPVQIMLCGHRYCFSCFEKIKQHSINSGRSLNCPIDRKEVDLNQVFIDTGMARIISDLHVKCAFVRRGCFWTGELRYFEDHKAKCSIGEVDNRHSKEPCVTPAVLRDILTKIAKCEEGLKEKDEEMTHLRSEVQKNEDNIRILKMENNDLRIKVYSLEEENTKLLEKYEDILLMRTCSESNGDRKYEQQDQEPASSTLRKCLIDAMENIVISGKDEKSPAKERAKEQSDDWYPILNCSGEDANDSDVDTDSHRSRDGSQTSGEQDDSGGFGSYGGFGGYGGFGSYGNASSFDSGFHHKGDNTNFPYGYGRGRKGYRGEHERYWGEYGSNNDNSTTVQDNRGGKSKGNRGRYEMYGHESSDGGNSYIESNVSENGSGYGGAYSGRGYAGGAYSGRGSGGEAYSGRGYGHGGKGQYGDDAKVAYGGGGRGYGGDGRGYDDRGRGYGARGYGAGRGFGDNSRRPGGY